MIRVILRVGPSFENLISTLTYIALIMRFHTKIFRVGSATANRPATTQAAAPPIHKSVQWTKKETRETHLQQR
jgi:hypothetical protein